jgi:NitT/TauT family transport system substrate-binding protein
MRAPQADGWTRRRVLGGLTVAGAAGLLGLRPRLVAAEPPPETTTLRLYKLGGICIVPQYVAEELLHAEGFSDVQYVTLGYSETRIYQALGSGTFDIGMAFVPAFLIEVDAGAPIVLMGGCMSAASSSLARSRFVPSATSKGRPSPCLNSAPPTSSLLLAWRSMWA